MNTILAPKILINKEFQASAISPEIAALNFVEIPENFDLDNSEAAELLFYNLGKEDRRNDGRLIDKYNHVAKNLGSGGWWCGTMNPDGTASKWGCFKPNNPRTGKDGKILKYEHPPKTNTQPFFLKVDRRHWEKIAVNAGLEPPELEGLPDESIPFEFWSWAIATKKLPIIITEGAKKTASLLSAGFCAVGLSGINAGYRQPRTEGAKKKMGDAFLIDELKPFVQKGREISFCFDNDQKVSTKTNLKWAVAKMGTLFKGCKKSVLAWFEYPELKGIDDFIFAKGEAELQRIWDERFQDTEMPAGQRRSKDDWAIAKWEKALNLPTKAEELKALYEEKTGETQPNITSRPPIQGDELKQYFEHSRVEAKTSTPIAPVVTYIEAKNPDEPYEGNGNGAIAKTSTPLEKPKRERTRVYGGSKNLNFSELCYFIKGELSHRLAYNQMRFDVLLDGKSFKHSDEPREWFFDNFGETANAGDILSRIAYEAKMNTFDPVVEDLMRCHKEAKRVPITNIAARYFGQDPDAFEDKDQKRNARIFNKCFELWLIAAVARQMQTADHLDDDAYTGCKVDNVLVLQGGQGAKKSTFFKTLAKHYFNESISDIQKNDSLLALHSSWIIELAEIDGITSKKDAASLKHYLTIGVDQFRVPYGRRSENHPRRSVFCGTVNPSRFLVDDENRRFWVIPVVGGLDNEMLKEERDGIWASAVDAYLAGQKWWLTAEEELELKAVTLDFTEQDLWQEPIEAYIEHKSCVNTNDILMNVFQFPLKDCGRRDQMRVTKILNRLGWTKEGKGYGASSPKMVNVRFNPDLEKFPDNSKHYSSGAKNSKKVGRSDQQSQKADGIKEVPDPTFDPTFGRSDQYQNGTTDPTSKKTTVQRGSVGSKVGNAETFAQNELQGSRSDLSNLLPENFSNPARHVNSKNVNPDRPPLAPIPEKYQRAGFIFAIGQKVRRKGISEVLTIALYPDQGGDFAAKRYFCRDQSGELIEIKQSELEKIGG